LEEQFKDPGFIERFEKAGEAWDVAVQIADLRRKAGLSQKALALKLRTTQQQVSRLESPAYEGHSLSMLRRVAKALHAHVHVVFEIDSPRTGHRVAETASPYGTLRKSR
jgi:transcriptional regulator with XRE-family HTH domain